MDVSAEEFFRKKKMEGTRSDALKRITAIVSYAEEGEIMEQYAKLKVEEALEKDKDDMDFIYSLLPEWTKRVPIGLDEIGYGTLSYEGDLDVKARVDRVLKSRSEG